MIYKTLGNFEGNTAAEYQRRNGVWYKRKKGDKTDFYPVNEDGQGILNNYYKDKSPLYFYNMPVLAVGGVVVAIGLFWVYRKAASYGTTTK